MNKIDKYILMFSLMLSFAGLHYFWEKELSLIIFWIIILEVKNLLGQKEDKK